MHRRCHTHGTRAIFQPLDGGPAPPHGTRRMTDEALRARGSDIWIWALVALATASVVALAVVQRNRTGGERPPTRVFSAVELPLLDRREYPSGRALPAGAVPLHYRKRNHARGGQGDQRPDPDVAPACAQRLVR